MQKGMIMTPPKFVLALLIGSVALAGCATKETKPAEPQPQPIAAAEPAPAPALPECKDVPAKSKTAAKSKTKSTAKEPECLPRAADKPAPAAPAAVAPVPANKGGYDLSRNKPVTDSSKAVAGEGTPVKGINDWEGEISGIPAADSRLTKLRIGMSEKEVKDLIGNPTDEGQYVTGKAFIPFYFGSDRIRWEMAYKGQGRLVFAQQSAGSSAVYLIWIIHNASDRGYR
jgi:hypothetical protein